MAFEVALAEEIWTSKYRFRKADGDGDRTFDQTAERAFRHVARLTKGAYVRFDLASAGELKRLLGAVAAYAAGGRQAMLAYGQREGGAALRLTRQLG